MPSQQVEIAETIAAVKRALKREREAPSDQSIAAASNRGNKLKQGAGYVHEGSLAYMHGPDVYKQKIEHAGYTRYILEPKPRRYNEYGDELEDSESDEEADADAADENAYSGIKLEELLCPLKHPSELPTHPALSHAFLSSALPDMVEATQDRLRQERANLWRAKHLNRQLIGDISWIPCEAVESADDWNIFEPKKSQLESVGSKKRKRDDNASELSQGAATEVMKSILVMNGVANVPTSEQILGSSSIVVSDESAADQDVPMTDATRADSVEGDTGVDQHASRCPPIETSKFAKSPAKGLQTDGPGNSIPPPATNGVHSQETRDDETREEGNTEKGENFRLEGTASADMLTRIDVDPTPRVPSEPDEASPPPPPRRITRALAANNTSNSQSSAPTPPLSPTPTLTSSSTSSLLQTDPLYLIPSSVHPSHPALDFHGLPIEEATETRRLLTTYIQKQEESVRGYEGVLSKLLKAQRLRDEVLEMCKAEGHIGEMSDGEDWIDYDQWGLQPGELRKGRDEDEDAVEENTIGGRKGKRRARN